MLFSIWHLVSPTILLPNNNSKMEHYAFEIIIKGKDSGAQY